MEIELKTTLQPVDIENANNRQIPLLNLAKKTYGFLPKMQLIMANMPPLLQSYLEGMAMFRNEGLFNPVEQEIIFMIISRQNDCKYCLTAHSMIAAKKTEIPDETIKKIKDYQPINDSKLNALAFFSSVMVEKRGFPAEN